MMQAKYITIYSLNIVLDTQLDLFRLFQVFTITVIELTNSAEFEQIFAHIGPDRITGVIICKDGQFSIEVNMRDCVVNIRYISDLDVGTFDRTFKDILQRTMNG